MSKTIVLHSEDNKYKCAAELIESADKVTDYSILCLFERTDKGYNLIAEARDNRLETEKDTVIDWLKIHNADLVRELDETKKKIVNLEQEQITEMKEHQEAMQMADQKIKELETKLAEKEKEIEEVKKWWSYQYERELKSHNQDKIALLEKLLLKVTTIDVLHQSGHYINQKKVNVVFKGEIDLQINKLREKK